MEILYKHEKIRYVLVGISANIIHFILYFFLIDILNVTNSDSKKMSYLMVLFFSFFMHKSFTFQITKTRLKTLILFIIIYISSFFINTSSHDFLDKSYNMFISFFGSLLVTIIFNYFSLKYIVFNKS